MGWPAHALLLDRQACCCWFLPTGSSRSSQHPLPQRLPAGRYPPEGEADQPDPELGPDLRPSSSSLGALGTSPGGAASDGGGSFGGRAQSLGRVSLRRVGLACVACCAFGSTVPGPALFTLLPCTSCLSTAYTCLPTSSTCAQLQRSGSRRRGGAYIPVIHCGSIRQAAQVVAMRELPHSRGCGDLAGLDLLGFGSSSSEGGGSQEDEDSDPLAALMGADLFAEPSGGSSSFCVGAGTSGEAAAAQPDLCRLAGAVAAAGVLLPQQLAGSGGSGFATLTASSGSTSGCEGAGPAGGSCGAPLERQRSLLPSSDIGCLAAVTFTFMHQPGGRGAGPLVDQDRMAA